MVVIPQGTRRHPGIRVTRLRKARLAAVMLAAVGIGLVVLPAYRRAVGQTLTDNGPSMTAAQCLQCHVPEKVLSHPVNKAPTLAIPAAFPLDQGMITCTTCHQDTMAAHSAATTDRPMLRVEASGMSFCNQCHEGSGNLTASGQHPRALAQAHIKWVVGGPVTTTPRSTSALADGVNTCLACHDGTVASDKYGGMSDGVSRQTGNHSVRVDYQASFMSGQNAKLVATGAVDRRILLTNGQVTCMSCHSLYSPEAGLLVIRNDNSALCTACHRE